MTTINPQLEIELRRIHCLAREPLSETLALEQWCRIGSDIAIGFAVGFLAVAWLMS